MQSLPTPEEPVEEKKVPESFTSEHYMLLSICYAAGLMVFNSLSMGPLIFTKILDVSDSTAGLLFAICTVPIFLFNFLFNLVIEGKWISDENEILLPRVAQHASVERHSISTRLVALAAPTSFMGDL